MRRIGFGRSLRGDMRSSRIYAASRRSYSSRRRRCRTSDWTLRRSSHCFSGAVLALPPPIPAKDESLAVALLTYGLVHQWTSSRAALVASLGRRRARGIALLAALEAGRQPTRAEMTAWTHGDGAVQLAFPELVT